MRGARPFYGALKAAVRYAQDRRVFDAPLADYPLTQIKLGRMAARFVADYGLPEYDATTLTPVMPTTIAVGVHGSSRA